MVLDTLQALDLNDSFLSGKPIDAIPPSLKIESSRFREIKRLNIPVRQRTSSLRNIILLSRACRLVVPLFL